MNTKKDIIYPIGFTAIDNRLFYTQEALSPNAFSVLIRIYRMSNGYDGKPKSLSNTFFQNYCSISKNTVTKVVRELESKGFITTQKRSRSNTLYSINLLGINNHYLTVINESQDLDEVCTNNVNELAQEMCSNKQNHLKQNSIKENINIPFSDFWDKYDYCKGKKSDVESKWISLTDEERALTMESLDKYLLSTPDKTYRKYPMSYLNTEAWNDEHIVPSERVSNTPMATTSTSQYNTNDVYSASFKPFEDNSSKHIKDELESNLEALGIALDNASAIGTDNKDAHNNSVDTPTDIVAISSQIHWSELKAKGLFKHKQNPTAIAPNTSKSKEIDDFLSRFSSKSKYNSKNIISGNSVTVNDCVS